jgi:hypothetical protein
VDEASTLSWKQRAIGFGTCFALGILLSFIVGGRCRNSASCRFPADVPDGRPGQRGRASPAPACRKLTDPRDLPPPCPLQSITFLWTLQLTAFAVMYTFGNLCSICSTMFLMGPCKQVTPPPLPPPASPPSPFPPALRLPRPSHAGIPTEQQGSWAADLAGTRLDELAAAHPAGREGGVAFSRASRGHI